MLFCVPKSLPCDFKPEIDLRVFFATEFCNYLCIQTVFIKKM